MSLKEYRRSCMDKYQHRTSGKAKAAIKSLKDRNIIRGLTVEYHCIYCHFWHIGRIKGE